MYELTEKDKAAILEKMKISFQVILDGEDNIEEVKKQPYGYIDIFNPKGYVQCYCKKGRGVKQEGHIVCQHCCGHPTTLLSENKLDDFKARSTSLKNSASIHFVSSQKNPMFFYVKQIPENELGVLIYNLSLTTKAKEDGTDLELSWKINGVVEIIPGVHSRGYKISRGKEVEVDIFKVLNINSNYVKINPPVYFENAINSIDFVLKHKKFNKYTAYMDLYNVIDVNIPKDSFFMMYMYLYAQYPSVELVTKMGMYNFCAHLMKKMVEAPERNAIKDMVKSFTKLLRADATDGTHVFNLPKYVVEDCLQRGATWEEMLAWQDIFELDTDSKIGKEMYYYATRHYLYVNMYQVFTYVAHGMMYGYTPMEFLNYVAKQYEKAGGKVHPRKTYHQNQMIEYFVDYLRMCDTMDITPDRFPQNIKEAHDNIAVNFRTQESAVMSEVINKVGLAAEKHIPQAKEYNESDYIIMLPHSAKDIIQEGQNMRNCVGSYLQRIARRETLVFFIRRKSEPNESFITAEYRNGRITQLYYKNNRMVSETPLRHIANMYAENLNRAQFEIKRI